MATKRRKTKSRRRKSRKSCKYGKLKRRVKTKSGRKRRCKKKSRKKTKSRRRKRSYRFVNCGVPTDLRTCKDGEDAIMGDKIDVNGNNSTYSI